MKKLIILALLASACQSDDVTNQETAAPRYILFGHFYGECQGEKCVEIYKLTEDALYENTNDKYPPADTPYEGNFELMSNSNFEKVRDLMNQVPNELLEINSSVVGQPDAGDWGGVYFGMEENGEQRFWLIDKMDSNIPESIRPFVRKIEDSIEAVGS
ncbi:hypothetical protein WBG78_13150 [Chryseolinea sp. T2]|uniref:hypothetical protein n=1 Tax=Chryseolinea sp. T2 TaxID=3129255 RepID=UPI00307879DC